MIRVPIFAAAAALLAGCTTTQSPGAADAPPPTIPSTADHGVPETVDKTRILDPAAAVRLRANEGITLQWIGWERRGQLDVSIDDGIYRLQGGQNATDNRGSLYVNGRVTEIGSDYFILDGEISITDTPDEGRVCKQVKPWRFAITQGRTYWRLREFEWCDYLTDYIDIYFTPPTD